MPRLITVSLLLAWLLCLVPSPETGAPLEIHLKTRTYDPLSTEAQAKASSHRVADGDARRRVLAQFTRPLNPDEIDLLASRGARILGFIPDQAYVISIPSGLDWDPLPLRSQSPIAPSDKWSPLLASSLALSDAARDPDPVFYLVLFHEDVPPEDARTLALTQGLEVREHPNLSSLHLLVQGPEAVIRGLTEFDEVSYILPASEDLAKGWPVVPCENGVVGGYPLSPLAAAASTGPGWGSPRTAITLATTWGPLSNKLDAAATRGEIERALAEWSRVVQVTFRPGSSPAATRNLNILFATRSHGDTFPFTGTAGVIAHAFYPSPPNPEPIAGDVHFNDDMPLRIGADTDLFSVALHEFGHALGLPHMDSGNAVMYPYYRKYTALAAADIAAIRQFYLSTDSASGAPAFRVNVSPIANTAADTADLAGTVANGTLPIRVQWANNRGGGGTVLADSARRWSVRNVPLVAGANAIALTGTDASGARATESVAITRTGTPGNSPPPGAPAAPQLRVTSPNPNDRTTAPTIRLTGTASAPNGTRRILWSTATANGQAGGTTSWVIPALPLEQGANPVTLRLETTDGLAATAQFTLFRDASNDTTAPLITIVSPTTTGVSTSNASVVISGTAYDAGGVAEVTWQNSAGGTGTATGTNSWRAEVPIAQGFNTLIVRARDASGNTAWRSLNVTRR